MKILNVLGALVSAKGWPKPKTTEAFALANELDSLRETLLDVSSRLRGERPFTWDDLLKLREEARARKKNWVDWAAARTANVPFGTASDPQKRNVLKHVQQVLEAQVRQARSFADIHDVLTAIRHTGAIQ